MRCWLVVLGVAAGLAGMPVDGADQGISQWTVPMGGNAFSTGGEAGPGVRGGWRWDRPETVISCFFRVDRPADLQIALRALVQGESRIRATAAGKTFTADLKGAEPAAFPLGSIRVERAGYVRVDLQGIAKTGSVFAEASDLEITSATPELMLSCVKDNEANRFYWGRRGPSVHLSFRMPEARTMEWFYSELTVPDGKDPIGSFFMANGFGEGYFGIQVNGPTERRILFSVWSPFRTDNPRDIPEDQRVVALAKGEGIRIGEFGNEGSGGAEFSGLSVAFRRHLSLPQPGQTGRKREYHLHRLVPLACDGRMAIDRQLPPAQNRQAPDRHSFVSGKLLRPQWLDRAPRPLWQPVGARHRRQMASDPRSPLHRRRHRPPRLPARLRRRRGRQRLFPA